MKTLATRACLLETGSIGQARLAAKLIGVAPLALITPEPRHAHRVAQFPGFGLLLRATQVYDQNTLLPFLDTRSASETRHHQHGALIWPITHLLN